MFVDPSPITCSARIADATPPSDIDAPYRVHSWRSRSVVHRIGLHPNETGPCISKLTICRLAATAPTNALERGSSPGIGKIATTHQVVVYAGLPYGRKVAALKNRGIAAIRTAARCRFGGILWIYRDTLSAVPWRTPGNCPPPVWFMTR
jgi:hypothetical protein